MNSTEFGTLRPCPFCGSNRVSLLDTETGPVSMGVHFDEPVAIVLCFNCCAAAGFVKIGKRHTREEAREGAFEFWNSRADDQEDYDEL